MIIPLVEQAIRPLEESAGLRAALRELELVTRHGQPPRELTLAGLTDTAKLLVAALTARTLARPLVFLTTTNRRAEALLEPLRFFHGLLTGRPGASVVLLPASDVSPYRGLSRHPDIAAARAVALWRLASGEAEVVLAPVGAALGRLAGRGSYSVRGGLVDIFPPEGAPVRLELFGDRLEELRGFDPATQRSASPLTSATLVPLLEVGRTPERLEKLWALREGRAPEGAGNPFPGWEFLLPLAESFGATLLDLAPRAVLLLDEPQSLREEAGKLWERWEEDHTAAPPPAPPAPI